MSRRINANQALKVAQFFTKRKKNGRGDDDTLMTETMSLVSPAGDSNSGLSMFVLTPEEDTAMHLASIRQFAAYIICSMYLAGLDRAYGGVHTEVARLMTATQESSRNTVVDFSLVKNMLSTPISSISSFEMGRPQQSVNELELASEIAYVLDAGLSKFLFGKDRKRAAERAHGAASAAYGEESFEVRVGATDPNESAHEFAGKSRVTKTPSVHTYLALTLLDPYAYGISEKRAVLTFLVSVMQRAILRNTKPDAFEDRSAKDEIDAEIDSSLVLSSLSQSSLVEGDAEDASIIRAEIQKLPTFKKFVRCMREHSADAAHTSNPSFHALYTLLKGTYLVHFASYYLSMAVNTVLREEMNTEPKAPRPRPDKKCVLSRAVLSSIEGSARELAARVDSFRGAGGAPDRLDTQDLRRQIMKANIAVCELQDRCAYTHEGKPVTLDRLITKGSFVTIDAATAGALMDDDHATLARLLLGPGGHAAAAALKTETTFPLYTRSSQIFDRDAMHGAHDAGDEYSDDELCEIGKFHVAFMMFLVTRSTSDFHGDAGDEDEASPEERMRRVRFFRFRPIVLFLSRLYAFFYRSYTSLVQPKKEQPVIVTMLVGAGWKRSVQRENEAERMQKMFSSFTRVMSNMLLFCHHVKGDLYRGPIVMKQLRKLYFANLALMSVTQQKLLKTVPSCHPFHSGTKTQLTLPTAVAVKMIPTEFVLPPNYSVASLNDRTYNDPDQEAARKAAIGNARVLSGRKGAVELRAMQGADNVVNYIAATGAAGPREARAEHELRAGAAVPGAPTLKIDPAAFMRALSAAR